MTHTSRIKRRWLSVVCLLGALLVITGMHVTATDWFTNGSDGETDASGDAQDPSSWEAYAPVASNGDLELLLSDKKGCVRVRDMAADYTWRSWQSHELQADEVNGYTPLQDTVESVLSFTYFERKATDASYQTGYSMECSEVRRQTKTDGADVTYVFEEQGLEITVRFRLQGRTLLVTVPKDGVKETGDYLLADVSLLPYFGSGRDTDTGYVVMPDGSGSLIRFKEKHPQYDSVYDESVFGSDTVTVEEDIYAGLENIALPVFGVNHGDYGMTCDIREGKEDANLVCWPSGYRMDIVNAYPTFHLRRAYYATLSNTNSVRKYFTGEIAHDFTAAYTFLPKGKSGYSDMAASYRSYLLETGQMNPAVKTQAAMGLNIFMAAKESRMLSDVYTPVTTFSQAKSMLEELNGDGLTSLMVRLTGWEKDGYTAWPNRFPIPGKIGGAAGSWELSAYAEKAGVPLYYAANYLYADTKKGAVSLKNVVYQGNKLIAETNDKQTRYLFSPAYIRSLFGKDRDDYQKAGITGLALETMGEMTYFDYNPSYETISRKGTAGVWQELMDTWNKQGNWVSVQGGNAYVLPYAQWLSDIPSGDSGYFFWDESVPFYQMVVHGSVLYTGTPVNLFSDDKSDYLRMVEYGFTPLFILSHDDPSALVSSDYNRLFSSEFAQYKGRIAQEYERFTTELGGLGGKAMIGHEKVADGVFATAYEGGVTVYVNYNKTAYSRDGLTVPAQDLLVERTKE